MSPYNAATALHCWEYGAGLGHITALSHIARRLKTLGFSNTLVNPEGTDFINNDAFTSVLTMSNVAQLNGAPTRLSEQIVSYNSSILGFGFDEPKFVFTRLHLWRALFEETRPDLVVADYAPAALFAARSIGIPTVATGNGFTLPPANVEQYPRFLDKADPVPAPPLLASFNQGATLAGMPKIDALPKIFSADIHACFTMPELDPFAKIREPKAMGPLLGKSPPRIRKEPSEDAGIFVYLTHCSAQLRANLLAVLAIVGHPVSIYSLQITQEDRQLAKGTRIEFLENPVPLASICIENRLVIHLGGHLLTMELLLAGMPQLLLPIDMEKILLAHGVVNKGLAGQLRVDHPKTIDQIADKIRRVLRDETLPSRALEFASSRKQSEWHDGLDKLTDQVSKLLQI